MIRHVFKLVWNRKRSTFLVGLEIFICFLVLCGIIAAGTHYLILWQRPLGFDYENVWSVRVGGMAYGESEEQMKATRSSMVDLLRTVNAFPEVEAAAISTNEPYSGSSWTTNTWIGGERVELQRTFTTTKQREVFRLQVLQGRWLEETDAGYAYTPVVISENVAQGLFKTKDPVGQDLPRFDDHGQPQAPGEMKDDRDSRIYRIVGVSENYRRHGELGEEVYTMFIPVDFETSSELPQEIMVRVRPGTTAMFEEQLLRTLQAIAPQWTFDTELLTLKRRSVLFMYLAPVLVGGVVGGSLVIMVGLGLVGVLWLNVTRRTSELGLRRAVGASAASVRRQVLGELWALTSLAAVAGTVIFLQLPLFGVNFGMGWPVFLTGVILASIVLFGFVTVCGLYPAWLATRVQPAVALQYE